MSTHPRIHTRPVGFSKVFRWRRDNPQPVSVAVVGTFSDWQKLPLKFFREHGYWQVTVENIPGHRTHNYMLLVNGKPASDPNADGLAVPHTEEEKQFAFETARGPRVFMLYSQAK